MKLNKSPGARYLRRRMAQARAIALLVTLTFTTVVVLPAGNVRARETGLPSMTATGGSSVSQDTRRYRPRRRGRTRRRNNRNPVVRVITAPYRGAKAAGKSIGRGVRRLFGGEADVAHVSTIVPAIRKAIKDD